jgi:hypothetical protein
LDCLREIKNTPGAIFPGVFADGFSGHNHAMLGWWELAVGGLPPRRPELGGFLVRVLFPFYPF